MIRPSYITLGIGALFLTATACSEDAVENLQPLSEDVFLERLPAALCAKEAQCGNSECDPVNEGDRLDAYTTDYSEFDGACAARVIDWLGSVECSAFLAGDESGGWRCIADGPNCRAYVGDEEHGEPCAMQPEGKPYTIDNCSTGLACNGTGICEPCDGVWLPLRPR